MRRNEGLDVDFHEQLDLAAAADELGFAALWVRDVPLNGNWYPERFGHPDPMAMLGALAMRTRHAAIGSAATVLTLRHPLLVAKAALTIDQLSKGRLVLGLGSGDRMAEFVAFERSFDERRELFRRHWERVAAALETPPRVLMDDGTESSEAFEMRPAATRHIDMLAVGSGGQTLEWIARHASGWATYHRPPDVQRDRYALWRKAVERATPGEFRSFSTAMSLDLLDHADAAPEAIELGYRTGVAGLRSILEAMRDLGTHHVLLNLVPNGRPPGEVIEQIARDVAPMI
jgi:luciferase-type oxidoreductase